LEQALRNKNAKGYYYMKNLFIGVLFLLASSLCVADGNMSLIDPSAVEINNFNTRDITAQIALREALSEVNFYKIRELSNEKIALIEKEKLSWLDQMGNARVKELNRQIKYYEDQNKRYEREIKQFRKKL
jgi:hypothetical protein